MSLDTKYRPRTYADVLGQNAQKRVLTQFVKEGKGFHQSYVFCGQHGSGKTTMGRILARALLCEKPREGEPCDECPSCLTLLKEGSVHESFEELDAASKSKVADLERIISDVQYGTFSGKRRLYLFDESHQLSPKALDILLKPMEDCAEGSEEKKLVCIFCTTEPSKMRSTIFSRCAPAFVIQVVPPEEIAQRLVTICENEGLAYDFEALVSIAEIKECHIRDALKTVEGVSMLGAITKENLFSFLQLGVNDQALTLLEAIGKDLPRAVSIASEATSTVSPSTFYERLAEAVMVAYRASLGVGKIPFQWNADRIQALATRGESLLGIASRFSAPPYRPSPQTLVLDVSTVHFGLLAGTPATKIPNLVLEVKNRLEEPAGKIEVPSVSGTMEQKALPPEKVHSPVHVSSKPAAVAAEEPRNEGGVWVDARGIGPGPKNAKPSTTEGASTPVREAESDESTLAPNVFRDLVRFHFREAMSRGGTGRPR